MSKPDLISIDDARARILAGLAPTASEIVPLAAAAGRVLAVPVTARLTQPPADLSAMDGYALRADDGGLGATLRLTGEAPAGHPFAGRLGAGETVRIFTGSFIPDGADAVLLQEDATEADGLVRVGEAVSAGRHIRRKGQDFAAGETLIAAGQVLGARQVGLAAAANHPWLAVHRRPRIAILATGDEISLPGEEIPPGGIVSSNAHALAAFVAAKGGEAMVLPIALDDEAAIGVAVEAARGADMLVTTGGASVGAYDLVQAGLSARGLTVDFWKIAMRPGKPLMFGRVAGLPVLGLPGNPVSALVCALLFLGPAIERMAGLPGNPPATTQAVLGASLPANDRRADHWRAAFDQDGRVVPFAVQDSGMLKLLAHADALILRRPFAPAVDAGEAVEIIDLAGSGL